MLKDYKKHPSYGLVQFNRVHSSGSQKLFGSAIEDHHTTVCLTIRGGSVAHDSGRDWYHATGDLVEVELSAAQFVELLTAMNIGQGVPCTIRHIAGAGRIENPPNEGTETERTRDYFVDQMKGLAVKLKKMKQRVDETAEKPRLKKSDQKKLAADARALVQEVESNLPFYYAQFDAAVAKREAVAKAEIDATTMLTLQRLGMKKIEELLALSEAADAQKKLKK